MQNEEDWISRLEDVEDFIEEAPAWVRRNRNIVLAAVKQNGRALEDAHDDLKKDKEVVMAAVKQNGGALEDAHDDLKRDMEVALQAVKQDILALEHTPLDINSFLELSRTVASGYFILRLGNQSLFTQFLPLDLESGGGSIKRILRELPTNQEE